MQDPSVTTVVKVKDRKHVYQYDLSDDKLVIEYRYGKKEPIRISISPFALNSLRELLGVPFITHAIDIPVERPPGSVPKDGIQGQQTDEGLTRTGDGIESGMAQ